MWSKQAIDWTQDGNAYISVPFTWNLPAVYSRCVWYRQQGYQVKAGGPAVSLMPHYLSDVADCTGAVEALPRHNMEATFTSRGCINRCAFCAVPKIEGELVELKNWEPKPIVCDNNLLACSQRHFDLVVDRLKAISGIDFNQGLDARLLTDHHIDRIRELDVSVLRLAWDDIHMESVVLDAIHRLIDAGFPKSKIRVYVLIAFNDTPDDALYRCQTLKALGVLPYPQRFQPLDSLVKNSYVPPSWPETKLIDFQRYWSRQFQFDGIPFEEYDTRKRRKKFNRMTLR